METDRPFSIYLVLERDVDRANTTRIVETGLCHASTLRTFIYLYKFRVPFFKPLVWANIEIPSINVPTRLSLRNESFRNKGQASTLQVHRNNKKELVFLEENSGTNARILVRIREALVH